MDIVNAISSPRTALATVSLVACVGGFVILLQILLHRPKALYHIRSFLQSSLRESPKKPSDTDYSTVFPPSQRPVLGQLIPVASPGRDLSVSPRPVLPLDASYLSAPSSSYVYSGFTVEEIKTLGNFPDYSKLSGVPHPTPLKQFDIDKALPRPYRPFRWSYHQTMSFKKLETDFWIELESTYRDRVRQRQELFAQHGTDVLQALPGSELACKELMEMVLQFICIRYPNCFQLKGNIFINHVLGTKDDLSAKDPLLVLLDNVPEDFGISLRDHQTGRYMLRAGVICSSVDWNLGEKIGLGLPAIHKRVPDYKEKMELSMDRFFTKMPANGPIQRGSWGLEMGQPLYLPPGSEAVEHREHQRPDLRPDEVHLRVDWQTLRRLPLSGAIIFNFKALFTPLSEFKDEPYIPSLVLKILNEGNEGIMKYKGTWHVEHVAKPVLEEYERYQIAQGLMKPEWEPATLDESPFFPGWERKWTLQ
ncbi:hypothetical protein V2G26_016361 [Clonostachys chloroleuca]